ncbi:hypothetical protein H2201_008509 [Coniosporium apollinis]|uniref:NAD-dependent epimerase/dehydratase domain-containing protein n=1 Tax=Coniosporium apollinis TaxID=61459 RepID=A0ABQ9NJB1_9PEZI|nr:hypothetical protein H2201_008509 [Coniosporium apollinis]
MGDLKLLLTGATGYIGGSVLTTLLSSTHPSIRALSISAIVRGEDKAAQLADLGVKPIVIKSLDDLDAIRVAASLHDIVLNLASGYHTASARAEILGLAARKRQTGRDVYFLHQSGTSNLADRPITGYVQTRVFSDRDNIYELEVQREELEQYAQRTTDVVVVRTGKEVGVKTYIIMSPTIYGLGSAKVGNRFSIQIPSLVRAALQAGRAETVGKGEGVWNYVHIEDLTVLWEQLLLKVVQGAAIPEGEEGIYFSETGEFTWRSLAELVGKAGKELGKLETAEVAEISLEDAAKKWAGGNTQLAELGFASNARTKTGLAKELLNWEPVKTKEDWESSVKEEFEAIAKAQGA